MPSKASHLRQAAHNETVVHVLTVSGAAADWEVVTLFYAAVHLVEAKAANGNLHSTLHTTRSKFVHRCYRAAFIDFEHLLQLAKRARYDCARIVAADVVQARAWLTNIRAVLGT
jgi:hypothetical protein